MARLAFSGRTFLKWEDKAMSDHRIISRSKLPRMAARIVLALGMMLHAYPLCAATEYRLQPGDVIEFSVIGLPEWRHRVTVDVNGIVGLPLLGSVEVVGLTISQLRINVLQALQTKVIRQRGADGKENIIVIGPDEVTLNIAEYRPIYVIGDVAKPGEQQFRPGMTVRQAIALAGGVTPVKLPSSNPLIDAADLRSEYQTHLTEVEKQQAIVNRLRAELEAMTQRDPRDHKAPKAPDAPLPTSEIVRIETERMNARQGDFENERAYLSQVIQQVKSQLAYLEEQQRQTEKAFAEQSESLKQLRTMYDRGLVAQNRLVDEQRALAYTSERLLQTAARTAEVTKSERDLTRQLEKLPDQRRMDLLSELQEATALLSTTQVRLKSSAEKLLYARMPAAILRNVKQQQIRAYRKGRAEGDLVIAEDMEVISGDVIEVTLVLDEFPHIGEP